MDQECLLTHVAVPMKTSYVFVSEKNDMTSEKMKTEAETMLAPQSLVAEVQKMKSTGR